VLPFRVAVAAAARLKAVLAGLAVRVVVVLAAVRSQERQAPRIRVVVAVVLRAARTAADRV